MEPTDTLDNNKTFYNNTSALITNGQLTSRGVNLETIELDTSAITGEHYLKFICLHPSYPGAYTAGTVLYDISLEYGE